MMAARTCECGRILRGDALSVPAREVELKQGRIRVYGTRDWVSAPELDPRRLADVSTTCILSEIIAGSGAAKSCSTVRDDYAQCPARHWRSYDACGWALAPSDAVKLAFEKAHSRTSFRTLSRARSVAYSIVSFKSDSSDRSRIASAIS